MMNDSLLKEDSPDTTGERDSQEKPRETGANTALTAEGIKTSTALVVGNAANITKQAVSTAMTKLSEGYVEWHDLRTGKKDENYF